MVPIKSPKVKFLSATRPSTCVGALLGREGGRAGEREGGRRVRTGRGGREGRGTSQARSQGEPGEEGDLMKLAEVGGIHALVSKDSVDAEVLPGTEAARLSREPRREGRRQG